MYIVKVLSYSIFIRFSTSTCTGGQSRYGTNISGCQNFVNSIYYMPTFFSKLYFAKKDTMALLLNNYYN